MQATETNNEYGDIGVSQHGCRPRSASQERCTIELLCVVDESEDQIESPVSLQDCRLETEPP